MTPPIVLTTVGSNYTATVERFKLLGAVVLTASSAKGAPALYRLATHVFLPGGPDIHPAQYGKRLTHARPYAEKRDELELALADACILEGKPLFGVCRGHQAIAVAAGGTLYQDIEREMGVPHLWVMHDVELDTGTLLASLARVGRVAHPRLWVNSYHHQAVRRVPKGWKVVARAGDGVVEAIEHPSKPIVSVQWHPEALDTPKALNLFRGWLALNGRKGK